MVKLATPIRVSNSTLKIRSKLQTIQGLQEAKFVRRSQNKNSVENYSAFKNFQKFGVLK
jgi:hypothetical protein